MSTFPPINWQATLRGIRNVPTIPYATAGIRSLLGYVPAPEEAYTMQLGAEFAFYAGVYAAGLIPSALDSGFPALRKVVIYDPVGNANNGGVPSCHWSVTTFNARARLGGEPLYMGSFDRWEPYLQDEQAIFVLEQIIQNAELLGICEVSYNPPTKLWECVLEDDGRFNPYGEGMAEAYTRAEAISRAALAYALMRGNQPTVIDSLLPERV